MGVRLVREVLDHAPDTLTHGDVRLLLAIAEDANDATRTGWPGWELLARRMGWADHKDGGKNAVRKALTGLDERLAAAGYPDGVRVARGDGRDGRPVYAARGHASVYRVPAFRPPAGCGCALCTEREPNTAPLQRESESAPLTAAKGAKEWRQREPKSGAKGAKDCPPSPQSPQGSPHPPRARGRIGRLLAAAGASDDEMTEIVNRIKSGNAEIRNIAGYVETLARNGDLARVIDAVREDRMRAEVRAVLDQARSAPECAHRVPGGTLLHPVSGEPLCPMCRRRRHLVSVPTTAPA